MPDADWAIPPAFRPDPAELAFDLDRALAAVFGLNATVPADAFTAQTLGTERGGSAVAVAGTGVLVTIGYLITEATEIWLTGADGRVLAGHALGVDTRSGLGLIQPLGRLPTDGLAIGAPPEIGGGCVLAAGGGPDRAIATRLAARQEFAGYWEYLLEEALFTAPAHPFWGGAALIGSDGALAGIGSLVLQQGGPRGRDMNMSVPASLLPPALEAIRTTGRGPGPARPWLGLFAAEQDDAVVVAGVADGGPADQAGVRAGEVIRAVEDEAVRELAALWRAVWARGDAGVAVTLTLARGARERRVRIETGDRANFLRKPRLH